MAVDLDIVFVVELAKKYPDKFSRQQRAQWQTRKCYPSLPNLLWLANKSGIQDVSIFFKETQREASTLSEGAP